MLSTSRGTFTATVSDGTITAGPQVDSFGFCAQPYTLIASGSTEVTPTTRNWSDVVFHGVLTDYGIASGGICNVFFAAVGGSLSFTATS